MQDQQCVRIDIKEDLQQSQPQQNIKKIVVSPSTIRNRRYKKLQQLRKDGFFSEESIKLRHPLLYHNYMGSNSHRNRVMINLNNMTLSEFLQKNLMNLQFKERLKEELDNKIIEQDQSCRHQEGGNSSKEIEIEVESNQTTGYENKHNKREEDVNEKQWQIIQEQEIEMIEENLIDHAEQLFLDGKIQPQYIKYDQIDNNSDYDDLELESRDKQQAYFQGDSDKEEDERINEQYYTGVQDY